MPEEAQYCIYPLHITKKEGKKICCCIQTEELTDFPLLKICVFCGCAIIETSLITLGGEKVCGKGIGSSCECSLDTSHCSRWETLSICIQAPEGRRSVTESQVNR